ncbi:MAG: S8 family serine peptidase [Chloroflexi bacterium]|nr:S8 family serine peptidase [Chloroflexota bacterium]
MRSQRVVKLLANVITAVVLLLGPSTLAAQEGRTSPRQDADWSKLSIELRQALTSNAAGEVNIIVQMSAPSPISSVSDKPERDAKGKIAKHGGVASRSLGIVGGASGKINLRRLAALSREPAVRYISLDARLVATGGPYGGDLIDYTKALNADDVWATGFSGSGVTVAVLDSGVAALPNGIDPRRLVASIDLVGGPPSSPDPGGHGTHVAGIAAGRDANWSGIAPEANIASVRVIDRNGNARMSTVIQGIQWAVQNRKAYGIRVLNLSLGGPAFGSYRQDPLAAAVEVAWHAGIMVVAAAGNLGPGAGTIVTPGHDPYIVTVGGLDMNATASRADDLPLSYSSRGPTNDGLTKPDVVAPGRKIVSTRVVGSFLDKLLPDRVVDDVYFRLSGTSQAAAAVSGVAALMVNAAPGITPDQAKRRLMVSASAIRGYDANTVGAGYVDAAGAVRSKANGRQSIRPADSFAVVALPLIKGRTPLVWKDLSYNGGVDSRGTAWSNVTWDNVTWDNVTWDNVTWDNVTWDNVTWDNVTWDNVTWDNVTWDNVTWDNVTWDNVTWDNVTWDNVTWDNVTWDNVTWDNVTWD